MKPKTYKKIYDTIPVHYSQVEKEEIMRLVREFAEIYMNILDNDTTNES